MDLKPIASDYIEQFSKKNVEYLRKIFAPEIILRDWEIEAKGFQAVLDANINIFKKSEEIKIDLLNIYQDKETVICELKININDKETLYVVDILEFNNQNKIKKIFAYKGN